MVVCVCVSKNISSGDNSYSSTCVSLVLFCSVTGLDQCCFSTLGLVSSFSTGMGDHL